MNLIFVQIHQSTNHGYVLNVVQMNFLSMMSAHLHLGNIAPRNPKGGRDINIILDKNIEDFVNECNLISENTNDDQTDEDLYNNINSMVFYEI